ncbi:MAG: POTRA domain-containing protein, partial [Candidatus Aenigmatarchaeota archaeon]
MCRFLLVANICLFLGFSFYSALAQVPPSQTIGAIEQQQKELEEKKKVEEKIKEEKKEAPIEEVPKEEPTKQPITQKVLIKKIVVEGITLVSKKEIEKITSQFENKELTLEEMQKIADLITDLYRKKGYATSRAYLPPQTIKDGILNIKVVEGKVGKI